MRRMVEGHVRVILAYQRRDHLRVHLHHLRWSLSPEGEEW